ncbi:hypothetical protein C7377_1357 [Balneicella halophila]|uniref:Alginate export protein n=1 Tax=Balneicella halophila TaxID=1537566 RepID=A0A7L4UPQ9_BALHA|nr:alginate export family protein [Balneicella halophila]PVX51024.1 hypothetical protein C7377_1357 [Balneicella halophila]
MKKNYVMILVMIFSSMSLWAQNDGSKLTLDLQLRSRGELREGALVPKTEDELPGAFINNRTRLNLGYVKDFLEVGLSVQHVGVWGDDKQVHKDADFGVHEAWAKMTFGEGFFVKLGRQVISYDDQRILGALDWHVAGRHHDAVKLGYENAKHKLHFIAAFNQNKENVHGNYYDSSIGQPYKSMQTLWYNVSINPSVNMSFLFMNLGAQKIDYGLGLPKKVQYMQTAGSHMKFGVLPQLQATVSGYYQFGKTASEQDVSAYMLSGILNYKFSNNISAKLGTDYLSGQDESEELTAFNPLYGTHHKFYGFMDYFFVSPFADGYKPGLWDTYIGVNTMLVPKVSLGLTYHYFQMATDTYNRNDNNMSYLDKDLGSEIDLNAKWNIHKDITLTGGFSFALLSDSMDVVKGGDSDEFQYWTWLSLNISPRLFTR